jgi:hydrophobic/amphiphilic exporter-1 (mainly G- bacteria), HAE1 family
MNITRLFIEKPVMTSLVMFAVLLFGIIGYRQLPVSDLPNVDFPTINVSANLPGANPDTMAASVATPLEQEFSTIAGLDSMNSTSAMGTSQITLQFNLNRDIDAAAQDVQAAISTASRKLPPDMPTPPTMRKVNPADQPIFYLALSSEIQPLSVVDEYAEKLLAQQISMVSGVAQVNVMGSQKYAVRTRLDPLALTSRDLGIDEVTEAIRQGNVNLPVGALNGEYQTFTVKANGQLYNADAYRSLIVAYRNGAPVRLEDVGEVVDSVQNDKVASWFNGTRAIVLTVQRQPGTNTIDITNRIKALLPTFESILPPSIKLNMVYDRSLSIRKSVDDVQFTLVLTIVLVVFVIFLFLRSVFATVISSLALPMSIMGTFAAMSLLGYSLDNLSLLALTLSVGFVVDDAIVMLENITRHMEMGESRMEASINGAREIGFTILSMTLSLVAVFIPILFMGGLVGRLFNEFAMTMTVAILISGFISLTLTPMLCSRYLKIQTSENSNGLLRWSEKSFEFLHRLYESTLKQALEQRRLVLFSFFGLLVLTCLLFMVTPKGFMPGDDNSQIFGMTEAAQGTSFKDMVRHQKAIAAIVDKDPNIQGFVSSVGSGGSNSGGNTGRIFMTLKPPYERHLSVEQVIQQLRPKLAAVPGIRVFLQNPPSIRIGGQLTKSLYQLTLQGPEPEMLFKATTDLETKIRGLEGLQDVTTDLQVHNPQLNVTIDRDRASALGVTARQIEQTLSDAYGNRQVSTIYTPDNDYQVIVELAPEYQNNMDSLSMMYVRSTNGHLVPLSAVTTIEQAIGPLAVSHLGQFPSTTISFNLQQGVALASKIEEIKGLADNTLPSTVRYNFQGSAQAFQSSFEGMGLMLILAVLVIYIVLGILYESFIHPITILSGLPPAGMGALLTLILFNQELNLYGFLGLILLIGIVKKNAIMMIDFALEQQRHAAKSAMEAIYTASLVRFRPIMMTTMAALMGTLPIAFGIGAGSQSKQSLGLAVFGGLIVSQLLTLYITPVLYTYLDDFKAKLVKPGTRSPDMELQKL